MNDGELVALQQALQADPQDRTVRLTLLQKLVMAARWGEAEEVGTILLQSESPPEGTHALMGIVYGQCQRWDEALQQLQNALAMQPDEALVLFNIATVQAQQGDLQAARQTFEKVLTVHKGWAEAHYNLGTVLLRQAHYTDAIHAFEDALTWRSDYPEAHFNRGNAHAMKGLDPDGTLDYYELDCAINAYKAALQQRSGYLAALYNLGMLYKRMASPEGIRVWEQYLEAAQNVPEEAVWLARAREYQYDLRDRLR